MDAISLPEEIILTAKSKGLRSVAITDHGVAHGHADMYLLGKKHGMRVIYGVEAYLIHDLKEWHLLREKVAAEKKIKRDLDKPVVLLEEEGAVLEENNELTEEEVGKANAKSLRRKGHLVILACNRTGLSNLYRLIYEAHRDGFYGKPRMDKEMLSRLSAGLVASSACMGGIVSNKCWQYKSGDASWEEVLTEAKDYDRIFGRGRFFLELQFNETDAQRFINACMVKIHKETGIPLTVTTDSHYIGENDWSTQEVLYMLRSKKTVSTRGPDWHFDVRQLFIKSPDEMWKSFEKFGGELEPSIALDAFKNTLLIDSLVEDFEPDTHQRLPTLPYTNTFEEMGRRAIAGLRKLGLADRDEYKQQLLYEFKIIKEKGFANYFLVVQKMIEEARKTQQIGVGRGSAAGSLVCYALGITDLDPLPYGLMFERFMDPSRKDMPDIDVDFENVDETKAMLRRMFGPDNVACLSVYGTFQIKGLLKDLGRIYDIDNKEVNLVNKKIQTELRALYKAGEDKSSITINLSDVEKVSPTYNKFVEDHPLLGEHIRKLYGRNKFVGRHASGVVVGDDLPAETAVFAAKDKVTGHNITQTSFTEGIVNKNLGAMGFVKLDVLSIATLKIIHGALKVISSRTGQPVSDLREKIRPHNIGLDDPKVMKRVFWEGHCAGVFQFSGRGIRRMAQAVHPTTFDDVAAICALYRPGPLDSGMPKIFIEGKRHPDDVKYDHPLMEGIMKRTYGALIYQEQLMRFCQFMGKMELSDIQRIRKNLLKKIKGRSEEFLKKENEELSGKFIKGCIENGMTEEWGREWWEKILGWGSYGFNACLAKNTQVTTYSQEGKRKDKRIEDVRQGDLVETRDEKTGDRVLTEVMEVWDNGPRDVYEFALDDGRTVRCTMNHKFRTVTGEMLPISEIMERGLELVSTVGADESTRKPHSKDTRSSLEKLKAAIEAQPPGLILIGELYAQDRLG
jgi:DNA polymerase III subunit alpha